MLAFPSMLVSAAEAAGIAYPENPDAEYNPEEFPHWHILCTTQLGRPMEPGEHFDSALALAKIPVEQLKTMTAGEFRLAGVNC